MLNPSLYSDSHVRQFQTEEIRGRQIHQLDYQSRFNDEYQSRYNDEHSKGSRNLYNLMVYFTLGE